MTNKRINLIAGIITLTIIMLVCAFALRAQDTPTPKLTELEESRLVSMYKTVVLASVDQEQATQRRNAAVAKYNEMLTSLKSAHKWPDTTGFDIQIEQDHVNVKIPEPKSNVPPPATPVPASDSKKQSNEKEKH